MGHFLCPCDFLVIIANENADCKNALNHFERKDHNTTLKILTRDPKVDIA